MNDMKQKDDTMRATPETDEAQFGTGRVSVDFARRLERERDEARELAHELRDVLEGLLDPEYLYAFGKDDDSERCIVFHAQESAEKAIAKAKEVLGEA